MEVRNCEIDEMFLNLYTGQSQKYPFRTAVYEADCHYGTGAGRKSVPFAGIDENVSAV